MPELQASLPGKTPAHRTLLRMRNFIGPFHERDRLLLPGLPALHKAPSPRWILLRAALDIFFIPPGHPSHSRSPSRDLFGSMWDPPPIERHHGREGITPDSFYLRIFLPQYPCRISGGGTITVPGKIHKEKFPDHYHYVSRCRKIFFSFLRQEYPAGLFF